MATTIKLKNGSGAPLASDLVQGEPAFDLTNKRLYTEDSLGAVIEVGSNPSSLSINGTAVTATATEINTLDGITSTTAELNILDGVTSTAAELNILDGVTASTAEINLLDGVTATTAELNILDGVTSTAAELNILDGVTATTAELNILDGVTATAAELNVLDGVTAFVDEDNMVSNSATAIPSQQSVKAYVDSQVTAQDLDFQGDTGGALSIDLDSESLTIAGGTGIDTSGSLNTLTVAIDSTVATLTGSQTLTNKTLTTPVISSISNTGTLTLPTSTDTLVGRDTTDTLTNKTLTSAVLNTGVSGTAILDEDDMVSDSATQLATQQSIKAYVDSQVSSADALAELTDTNITTPVDGALLFYDTTTSKWIDNAVSGDITIADTGVAAIGSGVIVNADINASAAISVSKTALIGGTGLTLAGDTLSVDASQTHITAVGTIGTGTWQGSVIANTYVADDLTINNGTIENTTIGSATPSTGAFTTLSATGDLTVDTNTLVVDATNNRVGVGDSSPSVLLSVQNGSSEGTVAEFYGSTNGKFRALSLTSGTVNGFSGAEWTYSIDSSGGEHVFSNLSGELLRIKSNGNVGIGTSSPTHTLSVQGASNGTHAVFTGQTDGSRGLEINTKLLTSNDAWAQLNAPGVGGSNAQISLATGGTDRLVVDPNGNVGIGETSPDTALHVTRNFAEGTATAIPAIQTEGSFGGGISFLDGSKDCGIYVSNAGALMKFYTNRTIGTDSASSTLRMTLDGSGNLLIGRTSASSTVTGHYLLTGGKANHTTSDTEQMILNRINTTGSNKIMVSFLVNSGTAGSIQATAGGTPQFSSSSDVRLKDNVTDHESELANVMSLRPVRWDWKDTTLGSGEGFVAQELEQTAWADLVAEGDDGYKTVAGLGSVETRLIKAIQEQQAMIETLQAQVAELQGAN